MSYANKSIPVKWTAPEALFRLEYSSKSDVWSFGILLVELFTFGEEPYPLLTNQQAYDLIKQGKRMERPPEVPEAVFETVIAPCWNDDPSHRPPFSELFQILKKLEKRRPKKDPPRVTFENPGSKQSHYFNAPGNPSQSPQQQPKTNRYGDVTKQF